MKHLTFDVHNIFCDLKQSLEIFSRNFIIFCIISLCLDISPEYLFLSHILTLGLTIFLGKNIRQKFGNYLISLSLLINIYNNYDFSALLTVSLLVSAILYICKYCEIIEYFETFPKESYSFLSVMAGFYLLIIGLKYFFGLKCFIKHQYFYQNILSIYESLKFSNWKEIILAGISLFCSIFFAKSGMKNLAFFYSFVVSTLFCYYFKSHDQQIHSLFDNLSSVDLNYNFGLLPNLKFSLTSLRNIDFSHFFNYLYYSFFISGLIIIDNLINNKITDVKEQNYANYRNDIRNLSIINLISGLLANLINLANIEQYRAKNKKLNYIRFLSFLQIIYSILIIRYSENIFLYIAKSSISSFVIISSLQLIISNKIRDNKFVYMIIVPGFLAFLFLNMLEFYKLVLMISAIFIIKRFSHEKIKNFLEVTKNKYNFSLEQKIKNSAIYKIENDSFFGVISHHLGRDLTDKQTENNLIIDITNIQDLDRCSMTYFKEMLSMQIKNFKEVIVCCDQKLLKKVRSEIDLPIRIIAASEDDL